MWLLWKHKALGANHRIRRWRKRLKLSRTRAFGFRYTQLLLKISGDNHPYVGSEHIARDYRYADRRHHVVGL